MTATRRLFLELAAASLATALTAGPQSVAASPRRVPRAILFDAFAVFDSRPILAHANAVVPGRGADLVAAWRSRQFEYTWLRAAGRRYADFWTVTEDALVAAARGLGLALSADERARLLHATLELPVYPDVPSVLAALTSAGVRLALLSNLTERMLDTLLRNAGLMGVFERILSTDVARTYKPDPLAYQLGIDAMKLGRAEVVFAAFAGWDVAGAKWFGYPTFWVNRAGQPVEDLGAAPDATGATLDDLVAYMRS